jgi:hypothetical protein
MKRILVFIILISITSCSSVLKRVPAANKASIVCSELNQFKGLKTDSSEALKSCIDRTPIGGILEISPGQYGMAKQIELIKSITIKTLGLDQESENCSKDATHKCVEFLILPQLFTPKGLFVVDGSRIHFDHVVVNGNRNARIQSKWGEIREWTYNMTWIRNSGGSLSNSVLKNALTGTALEVKSGNADIVISNNTFMDNGLHKKGGNWADGLTIHDALNAKIVSNEFINNTDIDFVLGGCQKCVVQNNRITHTGGYDTSSFAALLIHSWPGGTSGNYMDSDISHNVIDCGPQRACGFGIYVGASAWYMVTDIVDVNLHDNKIENAQLGVNIDPIVKRNFSAHVYRNQVKNSGNLKMSTKCGSRYISKSYNIVPSERGTVDRSLDNIPDDNFSHENWIGCIPNFIKE